METVPLLTIEPSILSVPYTSYSVTWFVAVLEWQKVRVVRSGRARLTRFACCARGAAHHAMHTLLLPIGNGNKTMEHTAALVNRS